MLLDDEWGSNAEIAAFSEIIIFKFKYLIHQIIRAIIRIFNCKKRKYDKHVIFWKSLWYNKKWNNKSLIN